MPSGLDLIKLYDLEHHAGFDRTARAGTGIFSLTLLEMDCYDQAQTASNIVRATSMKRLPQLDNPVPFTTSHSS